ncbi:disease resistance protein RUN1 isoform X3 [Vigna angularis]|uniref:disease resistance protein RUN1 isoform X3 n=1 Tax=Phaseolus angularis TaxID=3914 RepID=UPI000809DB57|nr:disease resistance protein RUN1 isoform X3 [Vigna angularis]
MLKTKSGLQRFWDRFGTRSSGSTSSSYDSSDTIQNQHYRYDVFISFRGPDARNSFVDHLCSHLLRKGIFVFKDDHNLQKGESISPQLLQAIQLSRLSIIVFSKNYASSTWCLDEMTAIASCKQQSSQIVFPIFYDVDPSHVRHQNGVYKNNFLSHRWKFGKDRDKVLGWKRAMTDLANSAGWDMRDKPEFAQIQSIVQAVIKKLGHKFSRSVNDLIGIQPRVQALEDKLRLSSKSDDVRVLGIWGMNGIGKTTHAAVLYDKISHMFDASCFIEDVNKLYRDGGHTAVQKQIIHQTFRENIDMSNPIEISGIVENRLHSIKVLIVLDNVDELEQLENLAIKPRLLLKGSRMVITTTDEHILKVYEGDVLRHKLPLLNDADARELFCRNAFKCEDQSSNCAALIPEVLKYAQCLPLAIKVLGSFLCTRDADDWRDVLNRLENSPDDRIMNVLQLSVDGLQREEKQIFLHIACFFKGERVDYVKRILKCCGLHPDIGISRLTEKSLITISDEEIHMHELLQELGKKMVRDQSPEEPGSWSRIWLHKDFLHALTAETGTEKVKAIVLNKKEEMSECIVDGLSRMKELTLLILYHTRVSGRLEVLSDRLQYLLWHDYPFASLPPYFTAFNLVELNMPNSHITHLWEGGKEPCNFRCGFDLILPWDMGFRPVFGDTFLGNSIIRILQCVMNDNWIGFGFYVIFSRGIDFSSSHCSLSHLLYLSFESEYTEEYFDMRFNSERDEYFRSRHIWIIYMSREHCHFVKTGAHITFKAQPNVKIDALGLRPILKQDISDSKGKKYIKFSKLNHDHLDFEYVEKSNSGSGPKIQLPYNWYVTEEEQVENIDAKAKENNLSNAGL